MKIAVISDLHGNHHALDAVLDDLSQRGVDEIICAGDIVDPLPGSRKVLETLAKLKIPTLRGNHEDYVLRAVAKLAGDPMTYAPNWEPVRQVAGSLDENQIDLLRNLPLFLRRSDAVAGGLIICHASPRSTMSGWSKGVAPKLAAELSEFCAATFVCGHWHRQKTDVWGSAQLISIGSVGMSLNGKPEAEFAILEPHRGRWSVEHVNLAYDREAAWREYRDSGWVEKGGPTAWLLFDELRLGARRMSPFIAWTQNSQKPHPSWPYQNQAELESAIKTYLKEVGAWQELRQLLNLGS